MKQSDKNKKKNAGGPTLVQKVDKIMKMIPKGTFASVGGALGGAPGAALGGAISRLTGYGSYSVVHNSLMTQTSIGESAENIPTFSKGTHGSTIYHREFIRSIVVPSAPTAFVNISERLAVDNADVFPWLARLAARYQRYKVKGMVFQYRSTSTDFNNSGTVAIAVNYNATEGPYTSAPAILNSQYACSAKPSVSFYAPVECDPRSHPDGYYIRHESEVKSNTDFRMSSVGILNVATNGLSLPSGTILGELWVTYEVELISPYLGNDAILDVEQMISTYTYNTTGTRNWDTVNPTDAGGGTGLRFIAGFSDPDKSGKELVLDQYNVDANFSRPQLTANFATGKRRYYIECVTCPNTVASTVDWMATPSTVQSADAATVIFESTDTSIDGSISAGYFMYRAVLEFGPGQQYSPPCQGVQSATGTTSTIKMIFTVVRGVGGA
nr:MAG: capsid protein [Chemarfal virus 43]